jgi:uncharacterized repeat protein (TIGR01451 family)
LDKLYGFDTLISTISTDRFYTVNCNDTSYTLSFTNFPIIAINTRGVDIVMNITTKGSIAIADTNGSSSHSFIKVNVRGASSAFYPKKSYKIKFVADTINQKSKDTTLFGMREDSDWILLAMYNEPLRVMNATSHALWRNMHELYFQNQEPNALSAIRTKYVDVFVNGSYAGIYLLGEQIDRKQLQLKKTRDNGSIRGELYKGSDWTEATLFTGIPARNGNDTTWAGFELKYPDQAGFWTNLYDLVDSTVNWSDTKFINQITSKWHIDNLVDYFLFVNLVRATDNIGKNLYIARYKENEPYIFIAWDLDGTWGYIWDGSQQNTTNDILANGFFSRLLALNPASFKQKVKARWFTLRTGMLSTINLQNALTSNVSSLSLNGAYLREAVKWPIGNIDGGLAYSTTWISNRTTFLDNYFGQFPDPCTNPPAPTVTISASAITAGTSVTLTATGCPYTVVWNTGLTDNILDITPWESDSFWAICNQTGAGCESPASSTLTVTVEPDTSASLTQADLSLQLVSNQRVVQMDMPVRLTLAVTNDGPATANDVRIQNRLPSGLAYVGNADPAIQQTAGIINLKLDSLPAYQTQTFNFDVKLIQDGIFLNTAQILSTKTYDPDSSPGSGTADGQDDMALLDLKTTNHQGRLSISPNPNQRPLPVLLSNQPLPDSLTADLSLQLTLDQRVVKKNSSCSINMIISNAGALDATNVSVKCILPTGLQFLEGDLVSASENLVSASGLSITSGSSLSITFQAKAISLGSWTCRAEIIGSDKPDSDSIPGNGTNNGEDDTASVDLRVL